MKTLCLLPSELLKNLQYAQAYVLIEYIGVSSNYKHKICNIKWTNEHIKCLGVYIHKDLDKAIEYNIRKKLDKIANIIKIWNCRHLTLKGKVTIANSLQLQDLQTKIEANKITWIKNIIKDEIKTPWKAYLQFKLSDPIS
jgi:hypothetical protein